MFTICLLAAASTLLVFLNIRRIDALLEHLFGADRITSINNTLDRLLPGLGGTMIAGMGAITAWKLGILNTPATALAIGTGLGLTGFFYAALATHCTKAGSHSL